MPYIPYHIQSHHMKKMILIDIWFESYFNTLSYESLHCQFIISTITITIINVKIWAHINTLRFRIFDISAVIHVLLGLLLLIMDLQMMEVLQVYMMYEMIYLFCFVVSCYYVSLPFICQFWSIVLCRVMCFDHCLFYRFDFISYNRFIFMVIGKNITYYDTSSEYVFNSNNNHSNNSNSDLINGLLSFFSFFKNFIYQTSIIDRVETSQTLYTLYRCSICRICAMWHY